MWNYKQSLNAQCACIKNSMFFGTLKFQIACDLLYIYYFVCHCSNAPYCQINPLSFYCQQYISLSCNCTDRAGDCFISEEIIKIFGKVFIDIFLVW